ncbi:MAG: alpha/beta hydrolase [Candidatus Paracaedibacteraceae bacterium]|nr:alpha/beta hydrolase [Candidatus Paracaedibacteraceae bacterium]
MPDVIFNGPAGRIEGRFHPGQSKTAPIALLLHPDPKEGGSMNNKIVYALYRSFVERGFGALRINFRGVGRSEGAYDNGEGELSDAAAALDWLQSTYPLASHFWVGGFSFGAWIAMQLLMRRPELEGFVVVSPPANRYDFNFLAPCPVSGQIIQGTQDTIVPQPAVDALVTKLRNQRGIKIDYQVVENASHFFENEIPDIARLASTYLRQRFPMTEQRFRAS